MAVKGEHLIEIIPEPDDETGEYFWVLYHWHDAINEQDTSGWCNTGYCGWEKTPQQAFDEAHKAYLEELSEPK